MNSAIADVLRELAEIQTSRQRKWAYARAADAVAGLTAPIASFVLPDGTLRKIANIGPSSTRVILEVLTTGASPTVEQAMAERSHASAAELDKIGGAGGTFLSRAEVQAALKNRRLRALSLKDYRGDLQMHSTYSDGKQTLADMVETGLARGYEYSAVTDHSYGLPVAHGVSMARLAEQHREIDRLNELYAGRFRLIKGIDAAVSSSSWPPPTPGCANRPIRRGES